MRGGVPARAWIPAAAIVGLLVAGCGSNFDGGSGAAAETHPAGPAVKVAMDNLFFTPVVAHAAVGQRVVWTNQDGVLHNVVHTGGPSFASSPILKPGGTFSLKLTQPGTIRYVCTIHPWMKASIVVAK